MPCAQIYTLDGRTEERKRNVIETDAINHDIFMGVGADVKWTVRNEVACRCCAHFGGGHHQCHLVNLDTMNKERLSQCNKNKPSYAELVFLL